MIKQIKKMLEERNRIFSKRRKRIVDIRKKVINKWQDMEAN